MKHLVVTLASRLRGILISATLVALTTASAAAQQPSFKMNIGYQANWASIGNTFETLKHTNILDLYGIEPEFKAFAFGGPAGEAFLAGETDNVSAAEAPIVRAAARLPGTKLIARTNDYRCGLIVPASFNGKVQNLKGKKIGVAFAGGCFPLFLKKLEEMGIQHPMQEMQMLNMDAGDMPSALGSKVIDAFLIWDPSLERIVSGKAAKALWISSIGDHQGQGWLGISPTFIEKHGDAGVVRFLKAFMTANWWASNHINDARKWFSDTSRVPAEILAASDAADRNQRAPLPKVTDVDIKISDDNIATVQNIMDTLVELGLVQSKSDARSMVDNNYLDTAQKELAAGSHPDLSAIKVITP